MLLKPREKVRQQETAIAEYKTLSRTTIRSQFTSLVINIAALLTIDIIREKLGQRSEAATRGYIGITQDEVHNVEARVCL